jgi:hypothetical protein
MNNPYIHAFNRFCVKSRAGGQALSIMSDKRFELVKKYGYAIPNVKAIRTIAAHSPIIEIGPGRGYWTWLLRQAGARVVAFDTYQGKGWRKFRHHQWTQIRRGGPERVLEYPNHSLFLCWPYVDNMALDSVRNYTGEYVFYVGEDEGGCTANDEFFAYMENHFVLKELVNIPQYGGIDDYLFVFKRK